MEGARITTIAGAGPMVAVSVPGIYPALPLLALVAGRRAGRSSGPARRSRRR